MNAANNLTNPTYFIPDPWTKKKTSGSWLVHRLSEAVSQTVNDNSGGRTVSSLIAILLGYIMIPKRKSNANKACFEVER